MQVRPATPADATTVTGILAASYPALMRGAYPDSLLERALPLITRANPALLESGTYHLALAEDGEAVACGGWSHRPPERDSREAGEYAARFLNRAACSKSLLPHRLSGKPVPTFPHDALAHIRHFATHPDWTGRGAGRAIFERCEAEARAAGFTRFTCYSSRNGEPFYAALGFRRVREIEVPMGPELRFPSVLMVREIP